MIHASGLLGTRYDGLARNTIDYWMQPDDPTMSMPRVLHAIESAPVLPESSLRLYLHVPFCAQRCRFCAFSGGNSLDWRQAERYARLLVRQLRRMWARTAMQGRSIRSVNIGGGSPDLLGPAMASVLQAVHELPGFGDETELSVELTLSTVHRDFIDTLAAFGVTKVSFGLQSLDPEVRGHMRQPRSLQHLERVLEWIDGRIPVVNADLITGLPGQTRQGVAADLDELMAERRIHAISSYLLTPGAAPSLLAAIGAGTIPTAPCALDQALMRLETYGAFRRAGWVRHGTNTYVDPRRVDGPTLARLAGDECIGAAGYETFLLGVGPQAIATMPGVRVENLVDIEAWCAAVERGEPPYCVSKCSTIHQRDMALWTFPLRWEGLSRAHLSALRASSVISPRQEATLAALQQEGLVVEGPNGLALSLLGEVFMGHLVRDLKQDSSRAAVDAYIDEGEALGRAAATGRAPDTNALNNRQLAEIWLDGRRA
ncbi:radical SAM protein [Paraliomyxa miuraensis]|uniref:radical SAM protein n=1 Tax=Paraliomyxa miuraensis TaxID=376150 RepID=UPI00224C8953|nr:radical SAM protein [Paraliomyxa miuraensis]MCX4246545.1 radical SAM protein [Paraliomyxa miuraensis]